MHMFWRSRTRCLVAVVSSAVLAWPSAAHAQLGLLGGVIGMATPQKVYDATAVGKLVTQLSQQLQQINVARSHLQAQVDNMRKLGQYRVRDVNQTLAQIDALTRQGQAISYSVATVEQEFQRTFSGTVPGGRLSSAMTTDIRRQNERTLATVAATLAAARQTALQFGTATSALETMREQLGTIRSAQQATELGGLIGIHTAQELTLLRQQLAAQGNASAVMMANQVNRDLQGAAVQQAIQEEATRHVARSKDMRVEAVGFPTRGTP